MHSHRPGGPPPLPREKEEALRGEVEGFRERRRSLCEQAEEAMASLTAALEELADVDAGHRRRLRALREDPVPDGTQRAVESWVDANLSKFGPPGAKPPDLYDGALLAQRDPLTPSPEESE